MLAPVDAGLRFPHFFARGAAVPARPLDKGMGLAVARRTVFRPQDREDMGCVAERVAEGNLSMVGLGRESAEFKALRNAIATGALITSGRHLQHGDADQKSKSMELHTNCSSAALSFKSFTLLLSGSGVGRSYDDRLQVVDWRAAPRVKFVLSPRHQDHPRTREQLFRLGHEFGLLPFSVEDGVDANGNPAFRAYALADFDAAAEAEVRAFRDGILLPGAPARVASDKPYAFWSRGADGVWHTPAEKAESGIEIRRGRMVYYRIPDTREGWGKAVELYESMAFERKRKWILVLDFSDVRPLGAPIGGMQDRPASGPLSLLRGFHNIQTKVVEIARRDGMERWEQAMRVDHHLSEEVQVGGARRAARMSAKSWRDPGIFVFIAIKSKGGLWTSNNSVMVDAEFWRRVRRARRHVARHGSVDGLPRLTRHALRVFKEATANAYINGEPGFINGDKLDSHRTGKARQRPVITDGSDFGSRRYQASWGKGMLAAVARRAGRTRFPMVVNPCVTADSWVLTSEGARQVKDLIGRPFTAIVDGVPHEATGFWHTGDKTVLRIATARGYELRVTANHKVKVERDRKYLWHRVDGRMRKKGIERTFDWVEAGDLKPGDRLVIGNNRALGWERDDEAFDRGWLVGEIMGDGGYNPDAYNAYVRFWGDHAEQMAHLAAEIAARLPRDYFAPVPFKGAFPNVGDRTWMVQGRMLRDLVEGMIEPRSKTPLAALEKTPVSFQAGVLRGLFDADGSVQGNVGKGRSVRLAQSNLAVLKAAQRMLARHGIASTVYEDRKAAGTSMLPDGNGGLKEYAVQATHELVVSRDNMARFRDVVGFYDPDKAEALDAALASNTRGEYAEMFTSEVVSITEDGVEPVYDCTVSGAHAFDCNGLIVHNCGEVELHVLGAYCVIADYAPLLSCPYDFLSRPGGLLDDEEARIWDERVEETVRLAARFCMRVNLMDSLYHFEVGRTNRIGVGPTGIHEFAWARFGLGWEDLFDEKASAPFWELMSRFSEAAKDEARRYAAELGVEVPHTVTTVKPAGCRPWYALTTTDKGVFTLQELFEDHPEDADWGEIQGDYNAIQDDGVTKPVTRSFSNGEAEVLRIKLAYGLTVESTRNHPWFVKGIHTRRGGRPRFIPMDMWIKAEDLEPEMVLDVKVGVYDRAEHAALKPVSMFAIRMRGKNNPITQPGAMNPDLAWLLGYLWGDGTMSPASHRLRWLDRNLDNLLKANRIFREQFGIEGAIVKDPRKDASSLEIGNAELWHWLIKNGVFKYHADRIDLIPRIVRESAREDIVAFIAGLIDADGAIMRQKDKTVTLAQADYRFARHVQDVGWTVGVAFGMSHNTCGENWQQGRKSMYLMTVSAATAPDAVALLVRHSNKMAAADAEPREWRCDRPGRSPRRTLGKVEAIESIGVMPTFDVEVADNHWFYAGAVKSHNSTSKLYGLSEGAHLPARRQYLRWVQFRGQKGPDGAWRRDADPLLRAYEDSGYPVRELRTFPGMSIVGFPTVPLIVRLGLGDRIVTAPEATPEDQFRYLQLLERHWIGAEQGNQVSYTLKVYTDRHDLDAFRDLVAEYQPTIRCCSVMPSASEDTLGYEYLPEEEMSLESFGALVNFINDPEMAQEIDMHALQCASGACPI